MTRRWSSGARPGKPADAAPGEDSNGTIGEYCSGTDTRRRTREQSSDCSSIGSRGHASGPVYVEDAA